MITTVTMNAALDKAYFMNHVIENGTVMRVQECRTTAGGKGLNVARAASICGADVQATGLVGGFNGQYLESLLDKDEIHISSGTLRERHEAASTFWMRVMDLQNIWSQALKWHRKKNRIL